MIPDGNSGKYFRITLLRRLILLVLLVTPWNAHFPSTLREKSWKFTIFLVVLAFCEPNPRFRPLVGLKKDAISQKSPKISLKTANSGKILGPKETERIWVIKTKTTIYRRKFDKLIF